MSKVKNTKSKLISKIEAIKKINDNPNSVAESVYDKYLKDLPSNESLFGKKLDDFLINKNKKIDNNQNIFNELLIICDSILGSNHRLDRNKQEPTKLYSKKRLKFHAQNSAQKTLNKSKEIILNKVKEFFFVSDGICGTNQTINIDTLKLKPQEFDFLNVLTVDPTSTIGQIVYEDDNTTQKTKVNKELYSSFSGTSFEMLNKNNSLLFEMSWDVPTQTWDISGLTGNGSYTIEEFFNDYYSSIEFPEINQVIKSSMLMTVRSGDSTPLFNNGLNNLNRLVDKLFTICGTPTNRDDLSKQNAVDLFDENDREIEEYFNFDDVEGIDIDNEDAVKRNVLKFIDCDNFEIPINKTMLEDFIYLGYKKNVNDLVETTLNRVSMDAQTQSDSPQLQFNLSLLNSYILNLPKSVIMSVMSPKMFLPIVIFYKILKSGTDVVGDVLNTMKELSKLFWSIIKELYWLFVREFWKSIKVDLMSFVVLIVKQILKNKYKRYVVIVTSLIALLTKIVENKVDNCYEIFNSVLTTIETALSNNGPINIPGILLGLSDRLPGYSQDRAYLNIVERLENVGISTGPIFGEENNLPKIIKSIIDGNTEEIDTNSFIKVTNKEIILPSPVGPIIIPPGILNSIGKQI